jgi:hypothetical protein
MLCIGVIVAMMAVVFYRRKTAAWYTLRIVAIGLIMVGAALALSLTFGNRAGVTGHF